MTPTKRKAKRQLQSIGKWGKETGSRSFKLSSNFSFLKYCKRNKLINKKKKAWSFHGASICIKKKTEKMDVSTSIMPLISQKGSTTELKILTFNFLFHAYQCSTKNSSRCHTFSSLFIYLFIYLFRVKGGR